MKFIKLTRASSQVPIWVNFETVACFNVQDGHTLIFYSTVTPTGKLPYDTVKETPKEIMLKLYPPYCKTGPM